MQTENAQAFGGRLPLRDPSTLGGAERAMYDDIVRDQKPWADGAGFKLLDRRGQLLGPFNAFLGNPEITRALLAFDAALKTKVSFSERVREAVIIAVGGVWDAKYELYSHLIMGRKAGLSSEMIEALAAGELPDGLAPEEALAARVAREMSTKHRIDDALYEEAERTFGAKGLYEIGALIGEFSVTCTILNLFEVPVPDPDA